MTPSFPNPVFLAFLERVSPGVFLFGLLLFLLPKTWIEIRTMIYILIFVLFRDTLTPFHFWEIWTEGFLRFSNSRQLLYLLAFLSAGSVLGIYFFEPSMRKFVLWTRGWFLKEAGAGILGAILITGLVVGYRHLLFRNSAIKSPDFPSALLPSLFALSLAGNFFEEVLFRGYFQGILEQRISPMRAAIVSGIFFSACHSFLAISVTSLGIPVLLFTLFEGLLCAFLRNYGGVFSSTLAHGGGIFLLASGWVDG